MVNENQIAALRCIYSTWPASFTVGKVYPLCERKGTADSWQHMGDTVGDNRRRFKVYYTNNRYFALLGGVQFALTLNPV